MMSITEIAACITAALLDPSTSMEKINQMMDEAVKRVAVA